MKTDFKPPNTDWGGIAFAVIVILAVAVSCVLLVAWLFQMSEQELQNMNTEARCKTAGGEMGYSKCYKNGKEI